MRTSGEQSQCSPQGDAHGDICTTASLVIVFAMQLGGVLGSKQTALWLKALNSIFPVFGSKCL